MTLAQPTPDSTPGDPMPSVAEGEALVGALVGGRYRVSRVLGRGGMGVVLEVVHEALGQPYAVKVLSEAFARNDTVVKRFLREARTAAKIHHPHIVAVHDLGRLEDGRPYLVMDLVRGRTFKELVAEEGVVSPARLAELLAGVVDALERVHAQGVVHRDIKLENLMLAVQRDGPPVVKVLDFGVAAVMSGDAGDNRITQHGWVVGTPLYLPPEAGIGTRPDVRWDVYALGVVAYAMLTGRWPFDGEGPMVVLTRKMTQAPPPLSTAERPFSDAVERVVARALAQQADDRYGSARALLDALIEATHAAASPASGNTAADAPALTGGSPRPVGASVSPSSLAPAPAPALAQAPLPPRSAWAPQRPWRWAAMAWAGAAGAAAIVAWLAARGPGEAPRATLEAAADPPAPRAPGVEAAALDRARDGALEPLASSSSSARARELTTASSRERGAAVEASDAPPRAARRTSPRERAGLSVRGAPPPSVASGGATAQSERGAARAAGGAAAAPPSVEAAPAAAPPSGERPRVVPVAPRDPDRAARLTADGLRALIAGRLPDAAASFRAALAADDRHVPAWRALATTCDRQALTREAREAYRRYLALAGPAEDAAVVAHARRRLEQLGGD